MVIFSKVRLGVAPDVNALASIVILIVFSGMIAASVVLNQHQKRLKKDKQLAFEEYKHQ